MRIQNEGVYQTGGSIQAGQMAVGRNARVAIRHLRAANEALEAKGLQEVQDKLNRLIEILQSHSASLARLDDVIAATDRVAKELASPKPSKLTLTSILSGIGEAAKSVGAVAGAVEALKTAVAVFL